NILTSINDENSSFMDFRLEQNYPNPFNSGTKITWQSPISGHILVRVFNILGTEVIKLVDEVKPSGTYEVEFDGSNLSSGVYFYQLVTQNLIQTKKMILLK
ncbi:MAG: T9SS type A sorting domain-containing protein, partial [Ignavibacteriaceae bacterium]|nr:T9SS type A sorting domain-containing protein [Ignavibacteriaceae bacterium]